MLNDGKLVTYEQIKKICEINKIKLGDVAKELNLSVSGFQKGVQNQSLSIKCVIPLCNILCMPVEQFFGVQGQKIYNTLNANGSHATNTQQYSDPTAVKALVKQLEEKDKMIASQADQIAKLINMLSLARG